jgi:signal transduction histidine kinase
MERDLHDGAQQQLLALTYDLRVALETAQNSSAEPAGEQLRVALDRAVAASAELREVAHGIFPAELASSGLVPALQSLADLHPLRLSVDVRADRRYPPEIETAAYAVVAEAVEDGGELRVRIADSDAGLQMTLERDAGWDTRLERLEDRIGAVAGDVRASGRQVEALLPVSPSA